jgi:hypothetical protein
MPSSIDDIPPQQQNLLSRNILPEKRTFQRTLSAESQETLDATPPTTTTNVTNDDEELFFDLYESPCLLKASNDAFDYQDYQEFGLMCSENFFGGCNYDNMTDLQQDLNSESVVEWTIVFDYEIYYTGDPIPAVDHVETIILEHLSATTGLNGCSAKESNITVPTVSLTSSGAVNGAGGLATDIGYRRRQTMEYIHDFSEEELSRMMALSSDPNNMLDPDYSECFEEYY